MKAYLSSIGKALERNRLRQKDIAEALGVTRGTAFAWAHGLKVPGGANLVRLVKYLQQYEPSVTERELVPLSGVMPDSVTDTDQTDKVVVDPS